MICVNLASETVLIAQPDWISLDLDSHEPDVFDTGLLSRLPGADESASLVYYAHVLEHVLRSQVPELLHYKAQGNTEKADFLVVEIIDQCVRRESAGELGKPYKLYAEEPERHQEMKAFLYERNGEDLAGYDPSPPSPAPQVRGQTGFRGFFRPFTVRRSRRSVSSLQANLRQVWFAWLLRRLPPAFMNQNVSMASVGERHHCLWDYAQLSEVLRQAAFVNVIRETFQTSRHGDFPFVPLDVDKNGNPRKGRESMYLEGNKAEVLQ